MINLLNVNSNQTSSLFRVSRSNTRIKNLFFIQKRGPKISDFLCSKGFSNFCEDLGKDFTKALKENPPKLPTSSSSSTSPIVPPSTPTSTQAPTNAPTNDIASNAPTQIPVSQPPAYSELTAAQKQKAMLHKAGQEMIAKSDESAYQPKFRATFENPDPQQQLKDWEEATQAKVGMVDRPGFSEDGHIVVNILGRNVMLTSAHAIPIIQKNPATTTPAPVSVSEGDRSPENPTTHSEPPIEGPSAYAVIQTSLLAIRPIASRLLSEENDKDSEEILAKKQYGNILPPGLPVSQKSLLDYQIQAIDWFILDLVVETVRLYITSPQEFRNYSQELHKLKKEKHSRPDEVELSSILLEDCLKRAEKRLAEGRPEKEVKPSIGMKKIPEEGSSKKYWKKKK